MIGEAPQVDPRAVSRLEVETLRVGNGLVDKQVQLLPELVAQPVVDAVVVAQNPGDIPLNGWVVNHLHRPRSCCT